MDPPAEIQQEGQDDRANANVEPLPTFQSMAFRMFCKMLRDFVVFVAIRELSRRSRRYCCNWRVMVIVIALLAVTLLLFLGTVRYITNGKVEGLAALTGAQSGLKLVEKHMAMENEIHQFENKNKLLSKNVLLERSSIVSELQGMEKSVETALAVIKEIIISLSEAGVGSLQQEMKEEGDRVYRLLEEEKSLTHERNSNVKLRKFLRHGNSAVETLKKELLLVEADMIDRQQKKKSDPAAAAARDI